MRRENVLGRYRDGSLPVTPAGISLILSSLDRIKAIVAGLEATGAEPAGDDAPLIAALNEAAEGRIAAPARRRRPTDAAEPRRRRRAAEAARRRPPPAAGRGAGARPGRGARAASRRRRPSASRSTCWKT